MRTDFIERGKGYVAKVQGDILGKTLKVASTYEAAKEVMEKVTEELNGLQLHTFPDELHRFWNSRERRESTFTKREKFADEYAIDAVKNNPSGSLCLAWEKRVFNRSATLTESMAVASMAAGVDTVRTILGICAKGDKTLNGVLQELRRYDQAASKR